MLEKQFQSKFNNWLKNVYQHSGAYELKVAKNNSLPFSAVVPHQLQALEQVRHGTLVFKLVDAGYQNPFDCFCLDKELAFVVIKYEKFFCLIAIDVFLNEKERSKRKSLVAERAKDIATITVPL